jgi:hypothetical protein
MFWKQAYMREGFVVNGPGGRRWLSVFLEGLVPIAFFFCGKRNKVRRRRRRRREKGQRENKSR